MEQVEGVTVLGIAKRMHKDLEDVDLSSHAAVVGILTTLLQHRADCMKSKAIEEQRKAQLEQQYGARVQVGGCGISRQ